MGRRGVPPGRLARERGGALRGLWALWFLAGAASAQEDCRPVGLAPGGGAVELSGTAPPEGVVCYALTGLHGERVSIAVADGANIVFSVDGLVDARDRYGFTAERGTYRILVGQLMRSVGAEPFRLRIAIRPRRAERRGGWRRRGSTQAATGPRSAGGTRVRAAAAAGGSAPPNRVMT